MHNGIFTTFIVDPTKNLQVTENIFINEILPLWYKINSKFAKTSIITNSKYVADTFPNTYLIDIDEAFDGKYHPMHNIMSSQIGCWKKMLKTISFGDEIIYLDVDAYLVTDKLLTLSEKVKDMSVTKKISPYGLSDAGVTVLRKTIKTISIINDIIDSLDNYRIRAHIEKYFDTHFRGDNELYLPNSHHNISLRGCELGSGPIDTIHGQCNIDLTDEDHTNIQFSIRKKEIDRLY